MNTLLKCSVVVITLFLIHSCEDTSPDMNWREKNDFISKDGRDIEANEVEEAGLLVYDILKFLLNKESKDSLEIISFPLPWNQLKDQKLNLNILQKIKNEYTFDIRGEYPGEENIYPTFFAQIATVPIDDRSYRSFNLLWKMKNHKYSFQDDINQNVEISFFNDPTNIPSKTSTRSFPDEGEYKTEVTHYTEIQYKPKDKETKISKGKVSFDIYAKTGYTKLKIDENSKGKNYSLDDNKLKIIDFTKDFAVYELLTDLKPDYKVQLLSEDDKRYKKKLSFKTNDWLLSKKTSGVMAVNKVVWEYVESINYKLKKEPFLAWFATEFMSKRTKFSKKELEEMYQIAFAVGHMESMILYKPKYEKIDAFYMELK